jgi:urocanate hydratase
MTLNDLINENITVKKFNNLSSKKVNEESYKILSKVNKTICKDIKKPCRILLVSETMNRDIVKEIIHLKNLAPTVVVSKDTNNHNEYAHYIPKNYIFTEVNDEFFNKLNFRRTSKNTKRNHVACS